MSDQGQTPAGITVTIPVQLEQDLEGAIISACAEKVLARWVTEHDPDTGDMDGRRLPTALERRLESAILDVIREQAAAAAPGIVETMLSEGVRRTDTWGDPRGEPVPLRALIAEKAKEALTYPAGQRGTNAITRFMNDAVDKALTGELQAELDAAKAALREQLTAKAAELLAASTARDAGVKL